MIRAKRICDGVSSCSRGDVPGAAPKPLINDGGHVIVRKSSRPCQTLALAQSQSDPVAGASPKARAFFGTAGS